MSLLSLPNELLLQIAEDFELAGDLFSLVCVNRRLSLLLTPLLYEFATEDGYEGKYAVVAFYWAAATGNRKLIQHVLEKGPDIMVIGMVNGWETIRYDPEKFNQSIVEFVVVCGPNLILKESLDGFEYPALHWAMMERRGNMVRFLLDEGADIQLGTLTGPRPRSRHTQWRAECITRNPLYLAVGDGRTVTARLLLQMGVDISARNFFSSRSAIQVATILGWKTMMGLLLERGANPNEMDPVVGIGLLNFAASLRYEGIVRILLENGADPNDRVGDRRRTILHDLVVNEKHVRWAGDMERIFRLLLENGADPTMPDSQGSSPRYYAQNHRGMSRVLAEKYPWSGVGFEYWKSKSLGESGSADATMRLRKDKRQSYTGWKFRRWCCQKQLDCVGAYKSLKRRLLRSKE